MTNLVIGASSGMGAAVAHRLASRGPLLLADRDVTGLETLAAELGSGVDTIGCDVTSRDDIENVVARIDSLEALVITAGISAANMLPGRRILEVNLVGTARVLDAVGPKLQPGSAAVCFASAAGHGVPPNPVLDDPLREGFIDALSDAGIDVDEPLIAYSFSKRGVMQLAARLAPAWGARGARIVSLSPGCIDTPMGRRELEQHPVMDDVVHATPLGRWGTPDEIAKVVAFLTSADASYITATDVLVDGGQVGAAADVLSAPVTAATEP